MQLASFFVKRFLITFIAALAFPTSVNAGTEREIAEFCLKAEDFSGCVKEMTAEKEPVLKKINENNNGESDFLDQANSKYLNENDYLTAINYLNDAIRIDPKQSEPYFVRGIIYFLEMQDYQNALLDIQKSVQLDNQDSDNYMTLGYLKAFYFDKKESGLEDLNKAIDLNPENSLAYLFRGEVNNLIYAKYYDDSDFRKAIQFANASTNDFSKSLELYKNNFNPYYKRLFPFGYLHYLYGSRGRVKYNLGVDYKNIKDIKNKELSKTLLNSSISDFDLLIENAPTLDEVENLKNPSYNFEVDFIKLTGYSWKGDTYSWLNKFATACKNWRKANKAWKALDYDVMTKYASISDGWSNYKTNCTR